MMRFLFSLEASVWAALNSWRHQCEVRKLVETKTIVRRDCSIEFEILNEKIIKIYQNKAKQTYKFSKHSTGRPISNANQTLEWIRLALELNDYVLDHVLIGSSKAEESVINFIFVELIFAYEP